MSSKFAPLNWFNKKEANHEVNKKEISTSKPVEHSDQYKIVVVLDESGSMDDIRQDMIDALNSLITEQKQISERPAKFTLVKFNDSVTKVVSNRDLREVSTLTRQDYRPDRSTSLYDALGETIDWFRYETNVLMVIITDGMENSSRKYNHSQIKQMLDEKQKYRNWSYVYLSDDLSTSRQADGLGLYENQSFCSKKTINKKGHASYLSKNINSAIKNYRQNGVSVQSQLNNDGY